MPLDKVVDVLAESPFGTIIGAALASKVSGITKRIYDEFAADPWGTSRAKADAISFAKRKAENLQKVSPKTSAKIQELSKNMAQNAGANSGVPLETWISPKGNYARKRRRNEQRYQIKLLKQNQTFGEGETTVGPSDFNVPERIQRYLWDVSSTFTTGYIADNKQGECHYSIQAPVWPHQFYQLYGNISTNANIASSFIANLGIWESIASYYISNDSVDPAELTIWELTPKHEILQSQLADVANGAEWFPKTQFGAPSDVWNYENGLFKHHNINFVAGMPAATPTKNVVPVFDKQSQDANGDNTAVTAVAADNPLCMVRSYSNSTVYNADLDADMKAAGLIDDHYYWNSPQEFPALTHNFKIKPKFRRWMMPGDRQIIKCCKTRPFQVGHTWAQKQIAPNATGTDSTRDWDRYVWRPSWGKLYLWRIRGINVWDTSENTGGDSRIPKQRINMGAALLNIFTHIDTYANMIPYPDELYQYKSGMVPLAQSADNMLFANERHITTNEPNQQ